MTMPKIRIYDLVEAIHLIDWASHLVEENQEDWDEADMQITCYELAKASRDWLKKGANHENSCI